MNINNTILNETDKHITIECCGCGSTAKKYKSQLKNDSKYLFCSLQCRNKLYSKVNTNWKPVNYKEYKYICKHCEKTFIVNGADFNAKNRVYCSKSCSAKAIKRCPHSVKTKILLSKITSQQNKQYRGKYAYTTHGGSTVYMRSSWEVKYANWLDRQQIQWAYEPEFTLSNGKIYTPDFKLDDGTIVEIKGYFRDDARKKWELFKSDYPHLKKKLLMKRELSKMGVI